MSRCRVVLGSWVVAWLCAGCGVTSKHPLTNEKTSVLDERLIGAWELVPEEARAGERKMKDAPRIYVGRVEGRENTLEAVVVSVEEERVKVQRFDLYTTRLDEHRYASVGTNDVYWILLYELEAPGRVTFHAMKEEVFVAAIEKGLLAGEVKTQKGTGLVKIATRTVRLTASPEALAAWLKDYSPACYEMERSGTLRRLVFEAEASAAPSPDPPPPPGAGGH